MSVFTETPLKIKDKGVEKNISVPWSDGGSGYIHCSFTMNRLQFGFML